MESMLRRRGLVMCNTDDYMYLCHSVLVSFCFFHRRASERLSSVPRSATETSRASVSKAVVLRQCARIESTTKLSSGYHCKLECWSELIHTRNYKMY